MILATGRNFQSVKHIYQQLHMDEYQTGALILLNGLALYDFHDQEYQQLPSFDIKTTKKIIRIAYFLLFRITIVGSQERIHYHCFYDRIYDFLRYIIKHKPIKKIEKTKTLPQHIEKIELGGTLFINFFYHILKILLKNYEVVKVSHHWIEILPKHTNKLHQLQYFINKYQISMNDLYAFGDGENDIEMLEFVDKSYAPNNALLKAKQAAHYECLSSKEDGVALQIETIINDCQK